VYRRYDLNLEKSAVEYNVERQLLGSLSMLAPKGPEEMERAPLDVVVVFDKSGSMSGEKVKHMH
jgi:uncharacterized protein with von Willebrand factor type A (vWA) domain